MVLVVKISGSGEVNTESILDDIADLWGDTEMIVIHGGSSELDKVLKDMGKEPDYVETPAGVKSRFTDEEAMEVFNMVMAGKINTVYTSKLLNRGVNAIGLSGIDGALLKGPRKSAVKVVEDGRKKIRRGEHSGKIEEVNTDLIESLLEDGYLPVVSLPMLGDDGTPVNADGDRAAAAIAAALEGELVIITDVSGVFLDPDDPNTLVEAVESKNDMSNVEDAAEGFMVKKLMAVKEALKGGAQNAVISGANNGKPITRALEDKGTTFYRGAV